MIALVCKLSSKCVNEEFFSFPFCFLLPGSIAVSGLQQFAHHPIPQQQQEQQEQDDQGKIQDIFCRTAMGPLFVAGALGQLGIQLIYIIIQFASVAEGIDTFNRILQKGRIIGSGLSGIGWQQPTPVFVEQFTGPSGSVGLQVAKCFSPHVG